MNPMRILHVIPALGPRHGGPSAVVLEMTQALRAAGVECEIACTRYNAGNTYESPWQGSEPGWVHTFDSNWLAGYAYSRDLSGWLEREVARFDVVHIHGVLRYTTFAAARYALDAGVPYVIRPAGALSDYGMSHKRLRKWLYLGSIERRALAGAAAFHATCDAEANSRTMLALRKQCFVIPHGVHPRPALHLGSASRQTILFLSRLDRKKGLELMLLALAEIAPRFPDLRCIIAGGGSRAYEARVRRITQRLGLSERVRFTGFVFADAKQALFDSSDIFVLPSEDENFGLAAAEAMASGMAVVLTRQVGIGESVTTAHAGLVIERDRAALSTAMAALLDDAKLARRCGRNARRLTTEQFSWPVVTRKLIEMYQQVRARGRDLATAGGEISSVAQNPTSRL